LFSRNVTYKIAPLKVLFDGDSSSIMFNIINISSNPIILGLSWLKKYNKIIDWKEHKVTFQ